MAVPSDHGWMGFATLRDLVLHGREIHPRRYPQRCEESNPKDNDICAMAKKPGADRPPLVLAEKLQEKTGKIIRVMPSIHHPIQERAYQQ
eukprot:13803227-Ditylum_brightwellii.AAC.1